MLSVLRNFCILHPTTWEVAHLLTFIAALLSITCLTFLGLSLMPYLCSRADGLVMRRREKEWSFLCGLIALLSGTGAYKLAAYVFMIG
nr:MULTISPECIES: hypothetical protein [Providencia]